jgi:hypothetical protein
MPCLAVHFWRIRQKTAASQTSNGFQALGVLIALDMALDKTPDMANLMPSERAALYNSAPPRRASVNHQTRRRRGSPTAPGRPSGAPRLLLLRFTAVPTARGCGCRQGRRGYARREQVSAVAKARAGPAAPINPSGDLRLAASGHHRVWRRSRCC